MLIPGENDDDDEIDELTRWVVEELGPEVPLHFTAFHPDWRMRKHAPTSTATLTRARAIALQNGARHVYTGNVRDLAGGRTTCAACGTVVIARDQYLLTAWYLDEEGRCRSCGAPCAGVFRGGPGHWGPRRLPVRLDGYRRGSA